MRNQVVAVIGGSGFIGQYVVNQLAKKGALVKVGCRHIQEGLHLVPLGNVGQIKLYPTNVRDETSLRQLLEDCDSVVNLVGILSERGKQTFEAIHIDASKKIAALAKSMGVKQFVHISALAADMQSSSQYARSKARGEEMVQLHFPEAVILRPSLIFGAEDKFFNLFADLATKSPVLPLIGGGHTKFQPVYVGDIAAAVITVLESEMQGGIYELAGPRVYTFKELMTYILSVTQRRCCLVSVPYKVGSAVGFFAQMLPNPLLTPDQVRLLHSDSIATKEYPGLSELGIQPTAVETIVPGYLKRFMRKS